MGSFLPLLSRDVLSRDAVLSPVEAGTLACISDIKNHFISKITISSYAVEEISSFIPNVWSRVVLFKMVTNDQGHYLRETLLGEIKGLLAIIALRKIYGFNITMTEHNFTQDSIENRIAKPLFPGVQDNVRLYIIKMDEQIIGGCLDNNTYYSGFFTSAEYNLPQVPWFRKDKGILIDPFSIQDDYIGVLSKDTLRNALIRWKTSTGTNYDYLESWQAEVSAQYSIDSPDSPLLPTTHPFSEQTKSVKLPVDIASIFTCTDDSHSTLYTSSNCTILPIKQDVYRRHSNDEIICTIEDRSVTIQISGIPVRKEYDEIINNIQLPVVCLWPDFRSESWHDYYIWQIKSGETVSIEPIIKSEETIEKKETVHSITWKLPEPPIGIALKNGNGQEIGVVKVDYSNSIDNNQGQNDYQIGIDFGTTHTAIAFKQSNREPMILTIKNRVLLLTRSQLNSEEFSLWGQGVRVPVSDFMERDFMTLNDIDVTIPTIYKRKLDENPMSPILHGVAVVAKRQFPPYGITPEQCNERAVNLMLEPFIERLKWKKQPERKYIGVYLPHLMKIIKAEIHSMGGKIGSIKCAYPISMDNERREFLSTVFGQNNNHFIPESEALVYYFGAMVHSDTPTISIDIGGGTTDIAMWHKGSLHMEASIKLAGNVCNEYIKSNPNILTDNIGWFDNRLTAYSNQLRQFIEQRPETTLSIILSEYGRRFAVNYTLSGGSQDTNLQKLAELIKFTYSSLFYYAGLMCQTKTSKLTFNKVCIYCAGNGWGHLDWAFGNTNENSFVQEINDTFKKVFCAAIGRDIENIEIKRSKKPKHEVAIGLLKQPDQQNQGGLTIESDAKKHIIGEDGFKIGQTVKNFSESFEVDNNQPPQIDNYFPETFTQYENFIKLLDNSTELPKSWKIRDAVQHELRSKNLQLVEPIFFTIIKAAIKNKWGVEIKWDD